MKSRIISTQGSTCGSDRHVGSIAKCWNYKAALNKGSRSRACGQGWYVEVVCRQSPHSRLRTQALLCDLTGDIRGKLSTTNVILPEPPLELTEGRFRITPRSLRI